MEEYDKERGYEHYHQYCQSIFPPTNKSESETALNRLGVQHLSILNEQLSKSTLHVFEQQAKRNTQKENIDYSEILVHEDQEFLHDLFKKIFTPSFDTILTHHLGSEYCIYWHTILCAMPSPIARRSFLWHCDKGPSSHVKLLVYLNGTDEHGGNTMFLDRPTTSAFTKTGYLFGPVNARQADLAMLAQQHSIDYHPQEWAMQPGDGILFEPSQVLHCGILPTKGPRYVMAFCLLPSPIPWDEALTRTNWKSLAKNYTWHDNADDIRQTLS